MITLSELFDRLKKVDEVSLLEVLNISSEEIVDRFEDYIEDLYEELAEEFEEENDEELQADN